MNKLLRSPIAAKTQGVLLAGARRTVKYASAPSSSRHPVFSLLSAPSQFGGDEIQILGLVLIVGVHAYSAAAGQCRFDTGGFQGLTDQCGQFHHRSIRVDSHELQRLTGTTGPLALPEVLPRYVVR